MKHTKFFMGAGAVVLAITAAFSVKADKKFAPATALFTAAGTQIATIASTLHLTTLTTSVQFKAKLGAITKTLYNATSASKPIFFK